MTPSRDAEPAAPDVDPGRHARRAGAEAFDAIAGSTPGPRSWVGDDVSTAAVNPSTAMATVVVDELVRGGVQHVVLAPGSRSTALALAMAARDDVQHHVRHDERSAAFVALGIARASGAPAAVVTTSGTAVANLAPATAEAHVAGVPLVLVTANRPAERQHVGDNQVFGQAGMFARLVRADVHLPAAADVEDEPRLWRSTVARTVAAARGHGGTVGPDAGGPAGPVHLDIGFREPTMPGLDDGRSRARPYMQVLDGRDDGAPWTSFVDAPGPGAGATSAVLEAISGRRALVVAGDVIVPVRCLDDLRRRGFPVLAEPTAGPGLGVGTPHAALILAARLDDPGLRPEVVLRLGHPTLSRAALVGLADVPTIQVGASGVVDPTRSVARVVTSEPDDLVRALLAHEVEPPPRDFTEAWDGASRAATTVVAAHLDGPDAAEPAVARRVAASTGDRTLVVASSLPIRDLADHAHAVTGRVIANRGLAGIDGFTSTAVGVALASGPTVALAGDLSFLHDHNGLLVDRHEVDLTLVVVDNDGGGIFHQVPAARSDDFERLFGTPHGRDLVAMAAAAGIPSGEAAVDDVAAEVAGPSRGLRVVVVRTDRVRGAAARRAILQDVRSTR